MMDEALLAIDMWEHHQPRGGISMKRRELTTLQATQTNAAPRAVPSCRCYRLHRTAQQWSPVSKANLRRQSIRITGQSPLDPRGRRAVSARDAYHFPLPSAEAERGREPSELQEASRTSDHLARSANPGPYTNKIVVISSSGSCRSFAYTWEELS